MPGVMVARNKLDPEIVKDPGEPKRRKYRKRKAPVPEHLKGTRMAADIRDRKRKPPQVPKNKSLEEIYEMDEDDPAFKQTPGIPRDTGSITPEEARSGKRTPREIMRADKQKRANARRARARKGEAVVTKAVEVLQATPVKAQKSKRGISGKVEKVYDEERVIAEGILSLDDWDDEELIRGYRRTRSGKFGQPPKFVPKEIQQEIFRRIVSRGDSKMRQAYLESIDELVQLAHNSTSDKVKLEAIKELMNRIVGKVPDKVHIAQEQPYEAFLGDAIVPIGDEWEPDPVADADVIAAGGALPMGSDFGGIKGAKEMPDE